MIFITNGIEIQNEDAVWTWMKYLNSYQKLMKHKNNQIKLWKSHWHVIILIVRRMDRLIEKKDTSDWMK